MTGPAEGKIPIQIEFFFEGIKIPCNAYIHVKGYSRAYVTHLDLEGFQAEGETSRIPAVVIGGIKNFTVILLRDIKINGRKGRKIKIRGITILDKGEKSGASVGIKDGGIFIGFRKEVIRRLEEIARSLQPYLF